MKIEAGKTYKTRNGRRVRVVCADVRDERYPVVGVVDYGDDGERAEDFTSDGRFTVERVSTPLDLVEEWRGPITYWATVNPDGNTLAISKTRSEAEKWAVDLRARVVKLVEVQS